MQVATLRAKYGALVPVFTERSRRIWAATEAHALGYSLQGNAKTREGRQHPDRDAQFRYIARVVRRGQRRRQPTISVDTNYDPSRIMRTDSGGSLIPSR